MSSKTVYLAGPVLGQNREGANGWRHYAADKLKDFGIIGISPLRCEPLIGAKYPNETPGDNKFGSARAIASKNLLDVKMCDLTLACLPLREDGSHQSYGTIVELSWAHALGKPVILVSDDPGIYKHPVINSCAGWVLKDLDEGLEVITGILAGYTGGKNV